MRTEKHNEFYDMLKSQRMFIGAVPGVKRFVDFWTGSEEGFAIARRDGVVTVTKGSNHRNFPAEYYPAYRYDRPPLVTPEIGSAEVLIIRIETDQGQNQGFLHCQSIPRSKREISYYFGDGPDVVNVSRAVPYRVLVDGEVMTAQNPPIWNYEIFVENDTHLWIATSVSIVQNGGTE